LYASVSSNIFNLPNCAAIGILYMDMESKGSGSGKMDCDWQSQCTTERKPATAYPNIHDAASGG